MATATYHLMEKAEWFKHKDLFHPQYGSHYIDLPSGKVLVAATFGTEASEEHFLATAHKDSLPHPVWEGTQKISASQAGELSHMGITTDHTVLDVARAAAKIHPKLKLRTF
jgi:hypothetical protein